MATRTTYHPGGFDAAKPAQNRAEEWTSTGYTRWDTAGVQVESRPLNSAEASAMAAQDAADALAAAQAANRVTVKAIITDLVAEKDRVDLVITKTNAQITGADTKDVARAAKRIADAAIELARFVKDM